MTPQQLTTTLAAAFPTQVRVLITGAPGIGKSDIVTQAAAAAGADLILSHPAVEDPTDSKGLPFAVKHTNGPHAGETHADFLPFGQLRQAMQATGPTVWFLDDLGQATPAVQAAYMQLLLAREVNGHRISDHVTFCAATNRRTDRSGVAGILEAVKSRFHCIVELQTTVSDWTTWALDHNISPELIAFIRFKPELLSAFAPTADLSNSPTPRTWAAVDKLSRLALPAAVRAETFAGAVGTAAATEYLAFLQMYTQLPNIDQILIDPMAAKVPDQPSILYAVTSALAHRTTVGNFARVAQYTQRLIDAKRAEFATLLVRDALRKTDNAIAQTTAFIRLITSPELASVFGGQQ